MLEEDRAFVGLKVRGHRGRDRLRFVGVALAELVEVLPVALVLGVALIMAGVLFAEFRLGDTREPQTLGSLLMGLHGFQAPSQLLPELLGLACLHQHHPPIVRSWMPVLKTAVAVLEFDICEISRRSRGLRLEGRLRL